jgi:hypothetical protein
MSNTKVVTVCNLYTLFVVYTLHAKSIVQQGLLHKESSNQTLSTVNKFLRPKLLLECFD